MVSFRPWTLRRDPLTEVDMVQVGQVQSGTNDIFRPLGEDDMATVVAFVDSVQDVGRVVTFSVIVALHVAVPVSGRTCWQW